MNLTGPGSIEAISAMGICPASGDVNIAGYRSTTNTYFMARYNATTGASVWPLEVYTGVHSGETTNRDMDIDFSLTGDIYLSYIVQSGATALQVVTKYEQVVLKDNAPYTAEQISLYPNPAHSFITISGVRGSGFMCVIDQQGRVVLEHNFEQDDPNLNVESLPTGLYTIVLQLEDLAEVFRFVKQVR